MGARTVRVDVGRRMEVGVHSVTAPETHEGHLVVVIPIAYIALVKAINPQDYTPNKG